MARESLIKKSKRKPKFSVQAHNRCKRCGRPRAFMRKFGLCRVCFRQMALNGEIPGVRGANMSAAEASGSPSASPMRSPEQLAGMADYHRARRGFANDTELAEVLGVHRTRLAEWKRGTVAPNTENARVLSHLSVVVRELEEFLDPEVISDWLSTEQITLGGHTPAEALRKGRLAEVLFAANATEHGAYV
jgi:small subunit ribosomal protein S14